MNLPPLDPHGVYFIEDLCGRLGVSRRTIERLRSHRSFPIEELPALDKRPRWSGAAIIQYLEQRQLRGFRRAS